MPSLVLLGWPVIALVFFTRLGPARGLIWSTPIGYLFLPDSFDIDLPLLPAYNKNTAIAVGIIGAYLILRNRFQEVTPASTDRTFHWMLIFLLGLIFFVPVMTSLTNTESLVYGPKVIPALRPWDAVSTVANTLPFCMTFVFAAMLLTRPGHFRELLQAMVICGLGYSLLVLFEIRMSPQLNVWVYGYFPHSWIQHLRGDGFRPIVFLYHGLSVGFFLLSVIIAAFALSRDKMSSKAFMLLSGAWMLGVLFLSKNLGATALALLFVPMVLLMGYRFQVISAACIAVVFLTYPLLKYHDITPVDRLVPVAAMISADRAASLQTRLDQETALVARAMNKPLFGWGGWGRPRVMDERGDDITIVDGLWVDVFGKSGWVGYIAFFGLLTVPLLVLARSRTDFTNASAVAGMAVISTANLIYMIPNATLTPVGMIVFGALAGFVRVGASARADQPGDTYEHLPHGRYPQYTRFPGTAPRVETTTRKPITQRARATK